MQPEVAIVPVHPVPPLRTFEEQVDAPRRNGNLDVISGHLKAGGRGHQEPLVLPGLFHLPEERGEGGLLEPGIRGVHEDDGQVPEHSRHDRVEPLRQRPSRGVCFQKKLTEGRAEVALRQEPHEPSKDLVDPLPQPDTVQRTLMGSLRRWEAERVKLVVDVQNMRPGSLLPVVVLRSEPEEGENGMPQEGLESLGQPDGRQGLIEAVERAGEEARLLAGGDEVAALLNEKPETMGRRTRGWMQEGDGPLSGAFREPPV
jgi:hypothetical protein